MNEKKTGLNLTVARLLRKAAAWAALVFVVGDLYFLATGQFEKLSYPLVAFPVVCYLLVLALSLYIKRRDPGDLPPTMDL